MKKNSLIIFSLLAGLMFFQSCDNNEIVYDDDVLSLYSGDPNVNVGYLKSVKFTGNEINLRVNNSPVNQSFAGDSIVQFTFNLLRNAEESTAVEMLVDEQAIKEYNDKNSTNYSALPAESFDFQVAETPEKSLTIKSGEKVSDTISVVLQKPELLDNIDGYLLAVRVNKISDNFKIAENNQLYFIKVSVDKKLLEINSEIPGYLLDRNPWVITVDPSAENANAPDKLRDTSTSDIAKDNGGFWLEFDLNKVHKLTGIHTQHWAALYSPSKVEISISNDGKKWQSLGILETGGTNQQNIKFRSVVETRYLRYDILETVSSRVDVTEFYIKAMAE